MMKIPLARAKAATASFPTLLEEGSVFLRIRRTQATGGSNSTAEGGGPFLAAATATTAVVATATAGAVVEASCAAATGVLGLLEAVVSFGVAEDVSASPVLSVLVSVSAFSGSLDVATSVLIFVDSLATIVSES